MDPYIHARAIFQTIISRSGGRNKSLAALVLFGVAYNMLAGKGTFFFNP